MTTNGLIPKSITIEGNFKPFNKGDPMGVSDGTSISITYEIPDGISRKDLNRMVLEEKRHIDLMCLVAERMKGSVPDSIFNARKAQILSAYAAKGIGRPTTEEENG